tara:strand:+ start:5748 stop:5987 length:240 start_codon:yes stop_codon:yes gene_type:complete
MENVKKERISIPPNNDKLWKYLTEGLSGRTNSLPSYPKNITREAYPSLSTTPTPFNVSFKNGVYKIFKSEDEKQENEDV